MRQELHIINLNTYNESKKDYSYNIEYFKGVIILKIGKQKQKIKKPIYNKVKVKKPKNYTREHLEYTCGIYRMFPCGKQYQYHMQYLHIPHVTERNIM